MTLFDKLMEKFALPVGAGTAAVKATAMPAAKALGILRGIEPGELPLYLRRAGLDPAAYGLTSELTRPALEGRAAQFMKNMIPSLNANAGSKWQQTLQYAQQMSEAMGRKFTDLTPVEMAQSHLTSTLPEVEKLLPANQSVEASKLYRQQALTGANEALPPPISPVKLPGDITPKQAGFLARARQYGISEKQAIDWAGVGEGAWDFTKNLTGYTDAAAGLGDFGRTWAAGSAGNWMGAGKALGSALGHTGLAALGYIPFAGQVGKGVAMAARYLPRLAKYAPAISHGISALANPVARAGSAARGAGNVARAISGGERGAQLAQAGHRLGLAGEATDLTAEAGLGEMPGLGKTFTKNFWQSRGQALNPWMKPEQVAQLSPAQQAYRLYTPRVAAMTAAGEGGRFMAPQGGGPLTREGYQMQMLERPQTYQEPAADVANYLRMY